MSKNKKPSPPPSPGIAELQNQVLSTVSTTVSSLAPGLGGLPPEAAQHEWEPRKPGETVNPGVPKAPVYDLNAPLGDPKAPENMLDNRGNLRMMPPQVTAATPQTETTNPLTESRPPAASFMASDLQGNAPLVGASAGSDGPLQEKDLELIQHEVARQTNRKLIYTPLLDAGINPQKLRPEIKKAIQDAAEDFISTPLLVNNYAKQLRDWGTGMAPRKIAGLLILLAGLQAVKTVLEGEDHE